MPAKIDDIILDTVKKRHQIVRQIYLEKRRTEPLRKIEDIVAEVAFKSGYSRMTVFRIIQGK